MGVIGICLATLGACSQSNEDTVRDVFWERATDGQVVVRVSFGCMEADFETEHSFDSANMQLSVRAVGTQRSADECSSEEEIGGLDDIPQVVHDQSSGRDWVLCESPEGQDFGAYCERE